MKFNKFHTYHSLAMSGALLLATLLWNPSAALAQPEQQSSAGKHGDSMMMQGNQAHGQMMSSKLMEQCRQMRQMHRKTQAMMKKQDKDLQQLVADLKQAPEGKRSDLTTKILTKLVNDRVALHQRMSKMNGRMMQIINEQMRMSAMTNRRGQRKSFAGEPMRMQQMGGGMMKGNQNMR